MSSLFGTPEHQSKLPPEQNKFFVGNGSDGKHYWLTPKDLYAEMKAEGYDPTAARAAFRQVSMADDAKTQERDELIDLYVSSLTRDAHTHVRAA